MTKLKFILLVVLAALLLMLRSYWISEGESRVQKKWDTEKTRIAAEAAKIEITGLKDLRKEESLLQEGNERIDQDDQARATKLLDDNVALAADNQRLQLDIDRLRRMPTSTTNTCPASILNERDQALLSLGECSNEYSTLAREFEDLARQAIGLQDYAKLCYKRGAVNER